jgi:hypothetical protein
MNKPVLDEQKPESEPSALSRKGAESRRSFVKRVLAAGAAANFARLAAAGERGGGTEGASPGSGPSAGGSLSGPQRRQLRAYQIRVQAALEEYQKPIPPHPNNGDEALYPTEFANYSKGLPHDRLGEVDLSAYQIYLDALATGNPADFEQIPLGGCQDPANRFLLVDPQAGLAFELEGIDSHATYLPPAPAFSSKEVTAELVELYWMALMRDVNFADYDCNKLAQMAAADLSRFGSAFAGPKDPTTGQVSTRTLFRDAFAGCLIGPYRSQFSYLAAPFDGNFLNQQVIHAMPGIDFMTAYPEWLSVQMGCQPSASLTFESEARYIRSGRDMAISVHNDIVYQDTYIAMLVLVFPFAGPSESGIIATPLNPGNPYLHSRNQVGFSTFGPTHIATLLPEVVNRAMKAAWFQKWFVHRRLRPEEYGGRIHNTFTGAAQYPIDTADLLASPLFTAHPQAGLVYSTFGSYLLPQAFPEGCPLHPSYPQGHSTAAGAAITVLKAFFDDTYVIPNPVVPSADGLSLVPYTGADAGQLTVGGELNKLASNIYESRDFAGVHYRSDGLQGLLLGEAVAISVLEDQAQTFTEDFPGFTFTKFDGTQVTVGGNT